MRRLVGLYRWLVRVIFYRFQHQAFRYAFEDQLMQWKPDVVHCNDWQTLALGSLMKRRLGSHLVFDSHELETHRNPPLSRRRRRWMQRYERRHLRACDQVTTVGPGIARYLAKTYEIAEPLVIYNAPIAARVLRPGAFERWGRVPLDDDLRSQVGVAGASFLLVAVGNLTLNRGLEAAIDALGLLPDHVHLALLGNATPRYRAYIVRYIKDRGLEQRVHLVEPVNPYCVTDYIACADLGLVPMSPVTLSYELTLPNKLFECAFAGLPLIVSDTFEMSRFVDQHGLGMQFLADDPLTLADAIRPWVEAKAGQRAAPWQRREDLGSFRTAFAYEQTSLPLRQAIAEADLVG